MENGSKIPQLRGLLTITIVLKTIKELGLFSRLCFIMLLNRLITNRGSGEIDFF